MMSTCLFLGISDRLIEWMKRSIMDVNKGAVFNVYTKSRMLTRM